MLKVTFITIDEIVVNNPYLRLDTDIDQLKKSIEKVGLINPLTINTKNELLAGGRRYQALKDLGETEVPVIIVDRQVLEQELISIDENLVRKPLNKLEFEKCLNRGREIYENLNPLADRIEMTPAPEKKKKSEVEVEENDTSFATVTSEKTGLSSGVIRSAIKRDAFSSKRIKEARGRGEISAAQTNELIKLDPGEQDQILPHIHDKTTIEVRKIVDAARKAGIDAAIEESEKIESVPREIARMKKAIKGLLKLITQINVEELVYEGSEKEALIQEVNTLNAELLTFVDNHGEYVGEFSPKNKSDRNEVELSQ